MVTLNNKGGKRLSKSIRIVSNVQNDARFHVAHGIQSPLQTRSPNRSHNYGSIKSITPTTGQFLR